MTDQTDRTVAVRTLNDAARAIPGVTCRANMTVGILTLSEEDRAAVLHNVTTFSNFDADNDPYGERDFGTIYRLTSGEWSQKRPDDSTAISETVFWKIDYYDNNLEFGSSEPWDSSKTKRVLTIMLSNEY
jgi:hypothetical protein